jgi:hypothetical protein
VGGAVDQPGGVQLKNVSCEVADEEGVDESLVPAVNRDCNRNTEREDDVQEFVVSERWWVMKMGFGEGLVLTLSGS